MPNPASSGFIPSGGNENSMAYLSTLSPSQQVVSKLQQLYGSMQPDSLQVLRTAFFSFVPYGTGSQQFNFFGFAIGGSNGSTSTTAQDTNMPLAGTFGTSALLVKSVLTAVQIDYANLAAYTGTDATTLAAEYLSGLVQAGVFYLDINGKNFVEIPKPFLYAPPADGSLRTYSSGATSANAGAPTWVDQSRRRETQWNMDPEVFIEAQTNFVARIQYASGALAPIITGLTSGPATPTVIRIGVRLDGLQFRPTQ